MGKRRKESGGWLDAFAVENPKEIESCSTCLPPTKNGLFIRVVCNRCDYFTRDLKKNMKRKEKESPRIFNDRTHLETRGRRV